jgi:hypothetical protein
MEGVGAGRGVCPNAQEMAQKETSATFGSFVMSSEVETSQIVLRGLPEIPRLCSE